MADDYLQIEDDQNRRAAAALVAANFGVFEFEPKTSRAFWDDRVRELWGAAPEDEIDYDFVISQVHPEDQDLHNRATEAALDPDGDGRMDFEYRLIARPDQPEVWIRAKARTRFENGEAVLLVGTVEDITARKVAELRNDMLVRELQHRLKNTLAIVGSIVDLSKNTHETLEGYSDALSGRVHALAQAQDLLRRNDWHDVWMSQICDSVLSGILNDRGQVEATWNSDILVPEERVLTTSMAIHELATNSIKYGALGKPGARVTISGTAEGATKTFEWRENGGSAAQPGKVPQRGFGSLLLGRIWPQEMNGVSTHEIASDGMIFRLSFGKATP